MHIQEGRQAAPDGGEAVLVLAGQLFQHGELPPLLLVVVQDQLGDVQAQPSRRAPRAARGS